MACLDCNPNHIPIPDDAVYYTGEDILELGIKKGMSLKTVNGLFAKAIVAATALSQNGVADIQAENIITQAPPLFLISDFTSCYDKIGVKKGRYSVINQGGDTYVFSYDFQEAISNVSSTLTVKRVEVVVYHTQNGVLSTYTKTAKASNAFNIQKANFPLSTSIKITLESDECGEVRLDKTLSVGGLPISEKQFAFDVVGSGGERIQSRYTQADLNEMFLAKLATVRNYVDDLVAGDYVNTVNQLKAQSDAIQDQLGETQYYMIGSGINARRLTPVEYLQEIYSLISSLADKIAAIEASRKAAGL